MDTKSSTVNLGRITNNPLDIEQWTQRLKKDAKVACRDLIKPIKDFREMVYNDPVLYSNAQGMFAEAHKLKKRTPLEWEPEPMNFEDFLDLLNAIMFTAPEAYQKGKGDNQQPAGMIGFPINALLAWPMATDFGYDFFSNQLVNQQLKKILRHWSKYLETEDSRYVLIEGNERHNSIAWLSQTAQDEMIKVASSALADDANPNPITPDTPFSEIFECEPDEEYYGFTSWDNFFTRKFKDNVRPVSAPDDDNVIINACESAPLDLKKNVSLSEKFWLKGQPYSLENMLDFDEFTEQFDGGTVYQAFLSALSYHRWHSPVKGKIVKTRIVNGSYYLENMGQGFFNRTTGPDPVAPNNSQKFLTAVATRALIFIESDNPAIGLMCVMPVGMAEVSSCEVTVKPGDYVNKGDELGMFHFGGSTHCLFFRKGVNLDFQYYENMGLDAKHNICVNTKLAEVTP